MRQEIYEIVTKLSCENYVGLYNILRVQNCEKLNYNIQVSHSSYKLTGANRSFNHSWVKYAFVLDSSTFLCFTELVWCIGTYEIL